MLPFADAQVVAKLNCEIDGHLSRDSQILDKEKAARRIRIIIAGVARNLGLSGEVQMFGSFSNGFKTGGSDLDIVFIGNSTSESTASVLSNVANEVSKYGFDNVTKIFSASVPLVKFTDQKTLMEVDFCISNELGVRNSMLLNAYCKYDDRVLKLGRLVKDWAKKHELVGTADGCLNSYAYMLLALYYLQTLTPPVVPNLQMLATDTVPIAVHKGGAEDVWETKFCDDTQAMKPSENASSVGELLLGFFHYYAQVFDWRRHAVCMRLGQPGVMIDKNFLSTSTNDDQWYLEDPFDLKHNLAGKCTKNGRKRILEEMAQSLGILTTQQGGWQQAFPDDPSECFYLKCRISQNVTPQAMLEIFEDVAEFKLLFPQPDGSGKLGVAFLEFDSAALRRRAHTKNESYVADCQLQLHYSSQAAMVEAVRHGNYSTYDMASYKMRKRILAARLQGDFSQPQHPPAFQEAAMMQMTLPYGYPPYNVMQPPPPPPAPHYFYPWGAPGAPPGNPPPTQADEATLTPVPKHAEAKSKGHATDAKASAAQTRFAKQQNSSIQHPKAKAGNSQSIGKSGVAASRSSGSPPSDVAKGGGGWLVVKIQDDMPKDKPVFTSDEAKKLQDLHAFYHRFNRDTVKGCDDHVVLQCELVSSVPPAQKLLPDDQVVKLKEIQKWLRSRT